MFYDHEEPRKESRWEAGSVCTDLAPKNKSKYTMLMCNYLEGRGLRYGFARRQGWYPCERKGARILIPATSQIPGHTYWQARAIEGQELRYESPNGPRRDSLIVMDRKSAATAIVEGPMDALAMAEIGVNAIALMGISPNDEALQHLVSLTSGKSVVYCLCDRDQVHGMMKVQSYLAQREIYSELKCPVLGKDVAEMTVEERKEVLK